MTMSSLSVPIRIESVRPGCTIGQRQVEDYSKQSKTQQKGLDPANGKYGALGDLGAVLYFIGLVTPCPKERRRR